MIQCGRMVYNIHPAVGTWLRLREAYNVSSVPSFPLVFTSRSRLVMTSIADMNMSEIMAIPKNDQMRVRPYTTAQVQTSVSVKEVSASNPSGIFYNWKVKTWQNGAKQMKDESTYSSILTQRAQLHKQVPVTNGPTYMSETSLMNHSSPKQMGNIFRGLGT